MHAAAKCILGLTALCCGLTGQAEDVHPCADLDGLAGVVYDAVLRAKDKETLGAIIAEVQKSVGAAQVPFLVQGANYLYAHKVKPTRSDFKAAVAQACELKHGLIEDRNHV